jgi:hypothetical protein
MGSTEVSGAHRRVIGRILSLGFPLPGVRVDNYSFVSAPSFFDYDALVVDIGALSRLIEGVLDGSVEAATYADRPVRAAEDAAGAVALADVLDRRREEAQRLLDNGGVVVCFAHPPVTHTVGGTGELDDLYWLGERAPHLTAGEGTQIEVCDHEHAMAPFLIGQHANISYRAHVADAPRAIARSYGGAVVAAELASDHGRIVVLPAIKAPPAGEGRYHMSEALQAGIRRMLGVMGEGREPGWAVAYTARLPGETGADDRARYARLLWQAGQLGLEDVVLDALKLIGFDVYANNPDALELRFQGTSVLLEIDASDSAVGLAAHYRLRQRIERAVERGGTAPRGLIIVNGYRHTVPSERPSQASQALRTLAETMSYAVAPSTGLFDAVAAKLSGDEAAVERYRASLVSTVGLVSGESPT